MPYNVTGSATLGSGNCAIITSTTPAGFITNLTTKSYRLVNGQYTGKIVLSFNKAGISNSMLANIAMYDTAGTSWVQYTS
ncbi:MAG: hypothetical protein WCG98_04025 [bacterium]